MILTRAAKKATISLIILVTLTLPIFSTEQPTLSKEWLTQNDWGREYWTPFGATDFVFREDGSFEIWFGSTSREQIFVGGNWNIKGDRLHLLRDSEGEGALSGREGFILSSEKKEFPPLIYRLVRAKSSFKYAYILEIVEEGMTNDSDLMRIWLKTVPAPVGEKRKVNGKETVVLKPRGAKATHNLRARSGPGTNFPYYTYADFGSLESDNAIPAGSEVTVLGRTTKKEKVGKWNNYWYYVEYERFERYIKKSDTFSSPGEGGQWVYGEFLSFE